MAKALEVGQRVTQNAFGSARNEMKGGEVSVWPVEVKFGTVVEVTPIRKGYKYVNLYWVQPDPPGYGKFLLRRSCLRVVKDEEN